MFLMECLDHVLDNSCKAGVMDVKYEYRRVYTEVTSRNMQFWINWTKITKWGKSLEIAQKYLGLPCKRLITPVKNPFAYLIHSFRSLVENKGAINYLYG